MSAPHPAPPPPRSGTSNCRQPAFDPQSISCLLLRGLLARPRMGERGRHPAREHSTFPFVFAAIKPHRPGLAKPKASAVL